MITNEDAIKMAKYVGIDVSDGRATRVWASDLLAFANFIADLEREACAKVCEEIEQDRWNLYKGRPPYTGSESGRADPHEQGVSMGAGECAAAIRAINFEGDTGFRPVSEMIAEKADGEQWSPDDMAYRPSGLSMEQAEQEPVAWVVYTEGGDAIDCICSEKPRLNKEQYTIPLYAAPVRTKDLTDDEIVYLWNMATSDFDFARSVIAADREKNRG